MASSRKIVVRIAVVLLYLHGTAVSLHLFHDHSCGHAEHGLQGVLVDIGRLSHDHRGESEPLSHDPEPSNTDGEPEPCDLCLLLQTYALSDGANSSADSHLAIVGDLRSVASSIDALDCFTSISARGPPLI